jgi:hypothetical protein
MKVTVNSLIALFVLRIANIETMFFTNVAGTCNRYAEYNEASEFLQEYYD